MKISEVAKELNVDISTIRFYERKGLVQPKRRADSKYREYSGEDIGELKSIILYRKLDFSIEEIRLLMAGEGNLQEMLLLRQEKLCRQQEEIAGSLALCDKMIADQAGEDLDVEYYLSYTRQAEQAGYHFPDIMPTLDLVTKNLQIERFVGFPLAGWILQSDLLRRMVAVLGEHGGHPSYRSCHQYRRMRQRRRKCHEGRGRLCVLYYVLYRSCHKSKVSVFASDDIDRMSES